MVSRLAIVPARGGSKRIPRKNIRDFCGKPMLSYILAAAESSCLFTKIHVSTDSQAIAAIARDLGHAPIFLRSAELSDDHTPLMPVIKFVTDTFETLGEKFDEIWSLMPCTPLVEAADLQEAASQFNAAGGKRPLMPVAPYPVPIEWAYSRGDDGTLVPLQKGMFAARSQDLESRYYDAGAFYVFPAAYVQSSVGAGDDTSFTSFILSRRKAIDIDTLDDWVIAEALFRSMRSHDPEGHI